MAEVAVAVVGSAAIDTNITKGSRVRKIGGVATYGSLTFRNCGIQTLVVTNVAPDDRKWFQGCTDAGLTWTFGDTPVTTRFINYNEEDGRRQEMPIRATPISRDQVRAATRQGGHVHLGPLHPRDIDKTAIEALVCWDGFITLDVQGYLRMVEAGTVSQFVSAGLDQALSVAHTIKADASEMEAMLSHFGTDTVGLLRRFGIGEVVITAGQSGGRVVLENSKVFTYEAKPVPHVADQTGAGDVFFAAYLTQRQHSAASVEETCGYAADMAAQHVSGLFIPDSVLYVPPEET